MHFLAWMLSLEGVAMLVSGVGLVVTALTGRGATTLMNGTCTGALACVAGSVLEWLCGALGVGLGLLGVAGLVAARETFRRPISGATRIVLLVYAVSWGLLATLACLRAGSPACDPATSLAAGVLAATIGGVHALAACSPRSRALAATAA
ncbi:MAG: hypothetical protein JNK15_19350 [Planctomycetes bacterium]|nr:hypothetical protein [Planctomycetota bacterium]